MGTLTFTVVVALIACAVVVYLQYHTIEEPTNSFKTTATTFLFPFLQEVLPVSVSQIIFNIFVADGNTVESPASSTGKLDKGRLFTKEELESFKYKYLAIAGEVFNVAATEKGNRHYGPEGHYNFFTGRDGSKAFVTGDFTDAGLTDDISDMDAKGIKDIEDWRQMYHKEYIYIGKLIGRFYDSDGKETAEKVRYKEKLKEAEKLKLAEKEFLKLYPPCNSEFKNQASRVWCSTLSGGISRQWTGVPRKLFTPGTGHYRCACVRTTGPPSTDLDSKSHNNRGDLDNPNLREYKDCKPTSESCRI